MSKKKKLKKRLERIEARLDGVIESHGETITGLCQSVTAVKKRTTRLGLALNQLAATNQKIVKLLENSNHSNHHPQRTVHYLEYGVLLVTSLPPTAPPDKGQQKITKAQNAPVDDNPVLAPLPPRVSSNDDGEDDDLAVDATEKVAAAAGA